VVRKLVQKYDQVGSKDRFSKRQRTTDHCTDKYNLCSGSDKGLDAAMPPVVQEGSFGSLEQKTSRSQPFVKKSGRELKDPNVAGKLGCKLRKPLTTYFLSKDLL